MKMILDVVQHVKGAGSPEGREGGSGNGDGKVQVPDFVGLVAKEAVPESKVLLATLGPSLLSSYPDVIQEKMPLYPKEPIRIKNSVRT